MDGAIAVGVEHLLSFLFERVAREDSNGGNNILNTIQELVSRKCKDSEGTLQEALKT